MTYYGLNGIGNRLYLLRESRGLSRATIADLLGFGVDQYGKIESGQRGLKTAHAITLADFYGVSCDYILRGIEAESIDVCKRTAIDQETLDVLIDNKEQEFYKIDLSNSLKKEGVEYIKDDDIQAVECAIIREYMVSNTLLNYLIQDVELWKHLRHASMQYVTCMEEIFEAYEINDGKPSAEEALNQMGLDASKYIAAQAFGNSFARIMNSAQFYREVSKLEDAEIDELVKLRFIEE